MKSTEIRVGNIVYADVGLPVMQLHRIVPADIPDIDIGKASVGPVTLTEEWLLKFGFKNGNKELTKCDLWDRYWIGSFEIFKESDNEWDYDCVVTIKYVHQLQNLYFALTGEELSL